MRTRKRGVGVMAALVVALVAGVLATTAVGWGRGSGSASGSAAVAAKPYDLVWITDSTGWGVASFYARQMKQSLKVNVRVHDEWVGGLPAAEILKRLRTPSDRWVGLIRNAEAIVVLGNPTGLGIKVADMGYCVVTGCQRPPASGPQTWTKYVATMKAIYKQVFAIRKGTPVILRTYTAYVPIISHAPSEASFPHVSWDSCGITDLCTKQWTGFNSAIAQAAAAYRVPVADVYTAFNGKSHREDPVAKGYIGPDGIHPNDTGRAVSAKTLGALGYKQVTPPK